MNLNQKLSEQTAESNTLVYNYDNKACDQVELADPDLRELENALG